MISSRKIQAHFLTIFGLLPTTFLVMHSFVYTLAKSKAHNKCSSSSHINSGNGKMEHIPNPGNVIPRYAKIIMEILLLFKHTPVKFLAYFCFRINHLYSKYLSGITIHLNHVFNFQQFLLTIN